LARKKKARRRLPEKKKREKVVKSCSRKSRGAHQGAASRLGEKLKVKKVKSG